MEVSGLCNVCGKAGMLFPCNMCGRRVCTDCITVKGVCKQCIGGRTMSIEEYRKKGL